MKVIQTLLKDKLLATGFVLLALSLFIFCIPFAVPAIDNTGLFIINYLISIGYFVVLLFSKRLKKGREGLHPFILFLVLFLIGAYSLNREMVVFEDSATWFSCLLVLVCINYLAFFLPAILSGLVAAWHVFYPWYRVHYISLSFLLPPSALPARRCYGRGPGHLPAQFCTAVALHIHHCTVKKNN